MSDTLEVTDEARLAYGEMRRTFAEFMMAMGAAEQAGVHTGEALTGIMREVIPPEVLESLPAPVRMMLS